MKANRRRLLLVVAVLAVALLIFGIAAAQDAPPAPVAAPGHLTAVLRNSIYEDNLVADFFIDGAMVATQVPTLEADVAPGVSHKVEARNVQSSDPNSSIAWGLYKINDTSTTIAVASGQTRWVALNLTAVYLQGLLFLSCDVQNWVSQDIQCMAEVTDSSGQIKGYTSLGGKGAERPPYFDPKIDQWRSSWFQQPGTYTVKYTLVGADAGEWSPAEIKQTVTVTAGAVVDWNKANPGAYTSAAFKENARLVITLGQPGVVADIFVDGVQVGTQVASALSWVKPLASHKVEVMNITDPAGAVWVADPANVSYPATGAEVSVVVPLHP